MKGYCIYLKKEIYASTQEETKEAEEDFQLAILYGHNRS